MHLKDELLDMYRSNNIQMLVNYFNLFVFEHGYVKFTKPYHSFSQIKNINFMFFILEGGGVAINSDGTEIPIKKNHIYLMPQKMKEWDFSFEPGSEKVYIHFSFDIADYADFFSVVDSIMEIEDTDGLSLILKECIESHSITSAIRFKAYITEAISRFMQNVEYDYNAKISAVRKYGFILNYINQHLSPSLTIDKIATNLNVSGSLLRNKFPSETGFKIKDYINKRLMESIKNDLAYSDQRIKDIAMKYDFSSEYFLSNWMLKHVGFRPLEFRKKYINATRKGYNAYDENMF